ncbi:glycine zipper domain-containing protein [Shewanella waksmanii]|uniref:glycine zipper domain-containing protein n=1 Tax=Shewanella waksmanii TaxID=213783 RepID=UPI0037363CF9
MTAIKTVLLTASLTLTLAGCASTDDNSSGEHRGLKTGAAGGALVGLALGAAAGDASLAAKGAMVGAATGAAAGAAADYQNDREDYRNENANKNININGLPANASTQQASTNATWSELDHFSGQWRVNIWATDKNGERIEASGIAKGSLAKTTAAQLHIDNLQVEGTEQQINGQVQLSYTPQAGYNLNTSFNNNPDMHFAGEFNQATARYQYYPVSVAGKTLNGDARENMRIELRFAGTDVILVDTYSQVKGQDVQIQSYRFTRQS